MPSSSPFPWPSSFPQWLPFVNPFAPLSPRARFRPSLPSRRPLTRLEQPGVSFASDPLRAPKEDLAEQRCRWECRSTKKRKKRKRKECVKSVIRDVATGKFTSKD